MRDFAEVVHGADALQFDALVERHCAAQALASPGELDGAALEAIGEESLELALALTGQPFPQDPMEQLLHAVEAVFRSWNDERAPALRRLNGIDDAMGTAVTVQAMVFGNGGSTSGAGVGFLHATQRPVRTSCISTFSSMLRERMLSPAGMPGRRARP